MNYFKELDENFDGRVSKDELIEAFDRLGIDILDEADDIMRNMDIDGNGYIDYSELKLTLMDWGMELKEKNLAHVFNVVEGMMSIEEMRVELIDIKQDDWVRFLHEIPNDGSYISVMDLKQYLKESIEQ